MSAVAVLAIILVTSDIISLPGNNGSVPGGTTTPGDPTNPGDPTDPSDPTNPGEPTNPGNPSNPGDPTNPGDPSNGGVVYDYNDLETAVRDIPRKEALDEIYILLSGYWITRTDPFVGFMINDKGEHEIEYGLFRTSFGARGRIIDGYATGAYEATLIVFFPAVPATAMDGARPESTETIYIDISGLYEPRTTIKVKSDKIGNGGWYTFEPGGSTLQQAYENWAT